MSDADPPSAERPVSVTDVLHKLRSWVVVIAVDGTVLDITGGNGTYFGYPNDEVVGRNTLEFLDVTSAEALVTTFMQGPETTIYAQPVAFPVVIVAADGTKHRSEIIPAGFEQNGHRGWVVTVTRLDSQAPSVTALHQIVQGNTLTEAAAAVAERLTYATADGSWTSFVAVEPHTTQGALLVGLPGTAAQAEMEQALQVGHPNALWDQVEPNGLSLFQMDEVPPTLAAAMERDGTTQLLLMRVDTGAGLGMAVLQFVNDHNNGGLSGNTVLYLSELRTVLTRAMERELGLRALADQASRDPLTGLFNRAGLVQNSACIGEDASMIFVDLDHFKQVNDTFGHAAGDRVLEEVANRLRWGCRSSDRVARIGGDEFVVLVSGGGPEVAESMAQRILTSIASPLPSGIGPKHVTASVGVSYFARTTPVTPMSEALQDVLACADHAMFTAKRGGRGVVVTSSSTLPVTT
jgi:diguanylate cyclase (GGDEF)-like protein